MPLEWISKEELREKLLKQLSINGVQFKNEKFRNLTKGGSLDFGILDEEMQIRILEGVLKDDNKKAHWIEFLGKRGAGWPGLGFLGITEARIIEKNRWIIENDSGKSFQDRFRSCFSSIPVPISSTSNYRKISDVIYGTGFRLSDNLVQECPDVDLKS